MSENKPASHRNFRHSLAFRYLVIVSAIFLAGQLLLSTLLGFTTYRQQLEGLTTKVAGQSEFLSTVIPEPLLRSDFLLLETLMKQSSQDPDIVYSVILSDQGKPMTRYLNQDNSLIAAALENSSNRTGILAVIETVRQTSTVREVRVPIVLNERLLGEVWLGYSIDSAIQNSLRAGFTTVILSLLASILLILITIVLFNRQISTPLQSLTETALALAAGDRNKRSALKRNDEIGSLSNAFNSMADDLQQVLENLEQRVADRTKALATSTEVSRRLSTILDQQQLVIEVVEQVKNAFDYYHAHIYLYDEAGKELLLAGGTGEAGQTLLARGHKIPRGRGLVGRCAENNVPVLVSDTSNDRDWLPNPLLPETKSEVAVPISIGNQVLGVLDVQHNITGGLNQEDVELLQSLANQVAIALQNARSYTAAQDRAEREALISSISQKIQSTTNIENAMQTAVREIGRAFGSKETRILLEAPVEKK